MTEPAAPKSEEEQLKETILREYPRLTPDSRFRFRCYREIDCFNVCCHDVNIVLTPYDVLRLRRRLGMGSQEFLLRHTVQPFTKEQKIPAVLLKMSDDERKACPFVGEAGCGVYEDRPWPCRMYPVGMASARTEANPAGGEFFFVLDEPHCHGGDESREWTIREWMDDQGVAEYDRQGELFKELTLHERLLKGPPLEPQKIDMFFMACYDLDRFRRFVLESRLLAMFEVEPARVERLKTDDEELLRFGNEWLRFSLFGDKTMRPRAEVLEAKRRELANRRD